MNSSSQNNHPFTADGAQKHDSTSLQQAQKYIEAEFGKLQTSHQKQSIGGDDQCMKSDFWRPVNPTDDGKAGEGMVRRTSSNMSEILEDVGKTLEESLGWHTWAQRLFGIFKGRMY